MNRIVTGLLISFVMLLASKVEAMENPLSNPDIEQFTLPNGLKVFMVVDRSAPLVAVDINYHVGSRNEKPGRTGFAHLFEHMMFQGSKHYNDDYFKPLQDIGGQVNGATSTDRTRYWEIVPAPYLERALWLESDRMAYLLDAMTQERLDNQKSVVSNERRQNYDNRPYGTVWEKMAAVLYPASHPYSWMTIGSMEDIGRATLADVSEFFKTYYTPNNATLAIVGDFEPETAKALVMKYFGAIPPGPPVSAIKNWDVSLAADVVLDMTDRVQLPRTYVTWPTVPQFAKDEAALDAFGMILGGSKTSRLFKELVYKRQIAQDAVAGQRSSQIAGVFDMMLTPRPGVDPLELEKAAIEVVEDVLKNGITKDELERVQISLTSSFVKDMQHIGGFGGMADRINAYQHFIGRPDAFRMDLQRYLDLKPKEVVEVARKYLKSYKVTARIMPDGSPAVSGNADADRSGLPGRGKDSPFNLPERRTFELSNGLKVVLVEQHKVPLVSMNLIVPGGCAVDPVGKEGLSSIMAALLSEGAGTRNSNQFAEAVEATGGQLDVAAGPDSWFVSSTVLKGSIRQMLELMQDLVSRPMFPADELERQRSERMTRLTQYMDIPQYVASVAAKRVAYGEHPYGHPSMGTRAAVEGLNLAEIKAVYHKWFYPKNAVLIVVGDVTRAEIEGALSKTLAAWKNTADVPDLVLPAPAGGRGSVTVVDMPGALQSVIVAATTAPARKGVDIAAMDVLNTAIGGQFVSRLNLNLREDKGYTYGARSQFDLNLAGGAFTASAPVQTDVTGLAVAEMIKELNGISSTSPITDTELKYVQGSIINGYAGRFATMEQIASELMEIYMFDLPVNALETYPAEINNVTGGAVTAAAARYLNPDNISLVIAGDASKVVPQLQTIGIRNEIRVVDREGKKLY